MSESPLHIARFSHPNRGLSNGLAISLVIHAALAATVWSLRTGDEPEPLPIQQPAPIVSLAPLEVVTLVEPPPPEVVEAKEAPTPSELDPVPEPADEPEHIADPEPDEPEDEDEDEDETLEPIAHAQPERDEESEPDRTAPDPVAPVAEPIHTATDGLTPVSNRPSPTVHTTTETARRTTTHTERNAPSDGEGVDRRALMRGYARTISRDIQRGLDYPSRARQRRIEGTVVIEIRIAGDGRILAARVHESSGFELLDRTALQRVLAIERFASPPNELAWNQRAMRVPVRFALRA